jgi:hypothetical protein
LPIENVVLNPIPKRQLNLLNKVKADSNEVQTLENQILKIQIEAEVTAGPRRPNQNNDRRSNNS